MNFKNKIFIISLIMLILFSISFVSASENDTLTTDDANNVLTSNEDNIQMESINNEIQTKTSENSKIDSVDEKNQTKTIGKNISSSKKESENDEWTYRQLINEIANTDFGDTLVLNHNVRHNGDSDEPHISITKSIIIDGQNHYISGNDEKSIFRFDDTDGGITLTLENLILKNGISDNGGIIHTKKNVNINIINCTFIDNEALEDGGAIYFDSKGKLDISDSTFDNCKTRITDEASAKHNGGAINTQDGTLTIDNCIFTNNTAGFGFGGAIYCDGECSGITNSVFKYNTARSRFGGAVYINDGNKNGLLIDNSIFMNNTCINIDKKQVCGGAVYYDGKGVVILNNSDFEGNQLIGVPSDIKTKHENSNTFYNFKGGAVFSKHDIWIGNCSFIKNHAIDQGGAVCSEEGIWWLDENSVFINNSVGYANSHIANKGGAVYASKFLNNAKGLIFIGNHGWYGGAIYIHNKNEVTFESCTFINNYVRNSDGKDTPGAAIYIDSSSSKISLINNIFYNNTATEDRGVYNCGSYGTITNNWYGYNDVNFENDAYLVEWHRIGKNDKRKDSNSLRITLSANQTEVYNSSVKLTLKFICSDKTEFTGKLTNWTVDFKSDNKGEFSDLQIGDNEATVIYTPEAGDHVVTAKVHGQEVSINLKQMGDLTWLQQQIDATPAGGVLNLNRNLTYVHDADLPVASGININKAMTINGNGYTVNGLKFSKLFSVHSSNVTFKNLKLIGGRGILHESGAISTDGGTSNLQVINCTFIDNQASSDDGGGAILLYSSDSKIINSSFFNNEASQGGAIDIRCPNVLIDGCEFRNNFATSEVFNGGGAINNLDENVTISNSVFLDNKAMVDTLDTVVKDNTLIMTLTGMQNYINAICSSTKIKFDNVTYWDGEITTGSNPIDSANESGQNITLEIYNSNNQIVKQVNLVTNKTGQAVYDFSKLDSGNYTFKAIHYEDNSYANYMTDEGSFNYTRDTHSPSKVTINIPEGKEFYYGECNIPFTVINGTEVEIYITNANSEVLYDNVTDSDNINVNLPASDEEYYIYVYNWGNETYNPSSDYKTFKILKINSTVSADPVLNVNYGQNVSVSFAGDGTSYNVTVYNDNNEIVFSTITNETSIDISNLDAGEYNLTIINLGNENMNQSMTSTRFIVDQLANNFEVKVDDGVYGHDVAITVIADVDGDYTVDVNSRIITVYVENGQGTTTIDDFGAGNYKANVSFANDNYINNATNCTFTIQKGQSHVGIIGLSENITLNQNTSIRFTDFYPAKYNITIYDENNQIVKSEIQNSLLYSVLLSEVGTYNLTVTNLGNDNVTGSTDSVVFNVNTNNYVYVYAEDSEYGRELYMVIEADVDGIYTVNLNGTNISIEVIKGTGEFWDLVNINAGDYTTEVIFDNPNYINIIDNANFTIYPVESNIKIYEIGNVSYGEDIYVRFHENYPTVFYIEVRDSNDTVVINTTFEYEDTNPEMSVILSDLDVGEYMVVIENLGDDVNIIENSNFMYFNVTKATNLTIDNIDNAKYGNNITITGQLVDIEGYPIVGTIRLVINNGSATVKTDTTGTFRYNYTLTKVGILNITANYDETNHYLASNASSQVEVTPQDTQIVLDKIDTIKSEDKVTIKGQLMDGNGKGIYGTVKLTINNGRATVKTDKNGYFTYNNTTLTKVGINNITATYLGSAKYLGSNNTTTVNVEKIATKIILNKVNSANVGEKIVISGQLLDENGKGRYGSIKLLINNGRATVKTDSDGNFTYTYTTTKGGELEIVASYLESNRFYASNSTTTTNISKIVTTITLNNINNVKKNNNITITGKLVDQNNKPVIGAVKLLINNGRKTIKTEEDGTFEYIYTVTKTGVNNITVSFIENNKYTSSNATTTVTVEKLATKITIKPIGTVKQKTNFTISGNIVDENNNAVTGTIKLLINNGRATIKSDSKGVFTFTYNATRAGKNTVTASYLESSNYLATNSTISYTVNKA